MKTKICKYCNKEKNVEEFRIIRKKYFYSYCRECEREKTHKYRLEHIEERKQYYLKNRELFNEYKRKKYNENKEFERNRIKEYRIKNKDKVALYRKKYDNIQINKIKSRIRCCLRDSFRRKKYKKNSNSEKIIGCEWEFFINYLLNTFKNNYGYDWDGKEKISIDHIIPLSTAKNEEEVIELCNYTNLQLLKAKDNLHKSNKLNWELKS